MAKRGSGVNSPLPSTVLLSQFGALWSLCLWRDFVTVMKDAITKLYRCIEIKMKAGLEDWCGPICQNVNGHQSCCDPKARWSLVAARLEFENHKSRGSRKGGESPIAGQYTQPTVG